MRHKKYLISYYKSDDKEFIPYFIIEYGDSMKDAIDFVRRIIDGIIIFAISEIDDSVSFEDFYGKES